MSGARLVVTVAVLGGFAGCDDATTPAGTAGRVEVEVVGDRDHSTATDATPSSQTADSGTAEGTIQLRARVYLWTEADSWLELTGHAAQAATVDASGGSATAIASADVASRSYARVRVVLEEVRANVTGGVQLSSGGALQGEVRVGAEGSTEPAVVERDLEVRVSAGGTTRLVVDLDADAWLSRADAETRTVARSELESAVRVFTGTATG